jgi:cytochrome c oxidase cbb3-type subunit I/II
MMFYVVPMYTSGITQGLMWKQFTPDGFLQYPNFLETVLQLLPMHMLRAIGGCLYLIGAVLMAFNLYRTAKSGQFEPDTEAQAPAAHPGRRTRPAHPWRHRWLEAKPVTVHRLTVVAS